MPSLRQITRANPSRDDRDYWIAGTDQDARNTGTSLRARSLDETEALARDCLDLCGITRVADVTGLDTVGIPVYHSVRPEAAPGLNTVTSGKGTTRAIARTSALMEAVERTWCELHADQPTRASYRDLRAAGSRVLDPRRLIPRQGHTWTVDVEMGWWPARDMVSNTTVLVPALSIFTPYPREHGLFSSNTIGLAVGNTPQEALLHGLLELVEHDCSAFGESLRQGYRIRPNSLPEAPATLIEMFAQAGITVHVQVYLTEIGIPTIHATTEDGHAQDGMLFNGGVGCHLDPEIAMVRALTEAAQSRLNVIAGAREDFDRQAYRRDANYADLQDRYREWTRHRSEIDFSDISSCSTGTTAGDLDLVFAGLKNAGVNTVLATELAPDGYPFSVTKAVVPGLEVFHEDQGRLGPRLRARINESSALSASGDTS